MGPLPKMQSYASDDRSSEGLVRRVCPLSSQSYDTVTACSQRFTGLIWKFLCLLSTCAQASSDQCYLRLCLPTYMLVLVNLPGFTTLSRHHRAPSSLPKTLDHVRISPLLLNSSLFSCLFFFFSVSRTLQRYSGAPYNAFLPQAMAPRII